jgi:hypothetical protein
MENMNDNRNDKRLSFHLYAPCNGQRHECDQYEGWRFRT